jgi:hypothetical protein
MVSCVFGKFEVGRDMLLGTLLAGLTLAMQVGWKLIPTSDWQAHKWQWILSFVVPYLSVLGIHIAYRAIAAPWRVHQAQEAAQSNVVAQYETEVSAAREEAAKAQESLNNYLKRDDIPQIVLRWDRMKEQQFAGLGIKRKFLHIDNRSQEDIFNVQIEDVSLNGKVGASFKRIPLVARDNSVCVQPRFNINIENHEDDFEMVIHASGVEYRDLPAENYFRDAFNGAHVRVPIYITFGRYGGRQYRAKFYFDSNIDTWEQTVQFIEVLPLMQPS